VTQDWLRHTSGRPVDLRQSARRTLSLSYFARNMISRPLVATMANAATRRQVVVVPRSALVAFRSISTTRRLGFASPVDKLPLEKSGDRDTKVDPISGYTFGQKGPPLGVGMASADDEPGKIHPSYKDGPSALTKAAHLFFFTEIIRGAHTDAQRIMNVLTIAILQACGLSSSNSSARPTPLCTLSRRGPSLLVSVANMHFVGTLAARSVASVSHLQYFHDVAS
jgi:hypothetical protein